MARSNLFFADAPEAGYPLQTIIVFVKRWGPALLAMVVIFAASSQTKPELPDFGDHDWLVKKLGHLCMYATLGWSYLRGLTYGGRTVTWRTVLLAVMAAALYGASDEYHQSFVAGRGSTKVDVVIDTLGAMLGGVVTMHWPRLRDAAAGRKSKSARP